MNVLIFTATDPMAPETCKWVAAALKPGELHPTWYVSAESPAKARVKMEDFIASQTPKPRPGRQKKPAPSLDVMDGEVL